MILGNVCELDQNLNHLFPGNNTPISGNMEYKKRPTFEKHKLNDSPIYDVTVRIMALSKDCMEVYASGTGVVIATNLILTAKHVFEDFSDKWRLSNRNMEQVVDSFNIWVVFISSNPDDLYHVYEVANVYLNPYSDLVLFHLDSFDRIGKNKSWKQSKLSLTLPKVGQRVVAFGFPKSEVQLERREDGQVDIMVNDEPSVSVGEIIEVYPEKRDSFLLPFPAIRINAKFEGGMSGGPIFDDQGQLIGIVCSSYDQIDSEDHLSYATLLWPLMATSLVDTTGKCYPLHDLAVKNIVSTIGLNHLVISETASPCIFGISYNA